VISRCQNIYGARTPRNQRTAFVAGGAHDVHSAQVDDDPVAQGTPSPIVSAATHLKPQVTIVFGSDCQLDVFGSPAVDNGARHPADKLDPDRCCGDVAVIARH
jgi:hypothetical protein